IVAAVRIVAPVAPVVVRGRNRAADDGAGREAAETPAPPATMPSTTVPAAPSHVLTAPGTAFLSARFAGIPDAGIAVSAMPTPHSSAAATFPWFDMLVSSEYPSGQVPRGNF